MGEFFQPTTQALPGTKPSEWTNSPYFTQLMGTQGQNINMPGSPISQTAMQQMQGAIGQNAPGLSDFFASMMRTGDMPAVNQTLANMNQAWQQNMDQIKAQAGLLPRGSGRDRYLGQGLGLATNQYQLGANQMLMDQLNKATANKFMGAQGLMGMPGYFAAPTSIEQALLSLQQPYDLANQQNAFNYNALQAGLLAPLLSPTPVDYQQQPSQFEQYFGWLGPLLQAIGGGVGQGLPTTLGPTGG